MADELRGACEAPSSHPTRKAQVLIEKLVTMAAGAVLAVLLCTPRGDLYPEEPGAAEELVRCPDCDAKGRAPCPTCHGKGELFRVCDICDGSGQRPCPVCCKDEKGQPGGRPGLVPCAYCGGKGVLGNTGKTCSRCNGEQVVPCEACLGKGTLPCRKEVFDKVCPTCRFAGRVTCPTCGGTTMVSPSMIVSKRQAARAPDQETLELPREKENGEKPEEDDTPPSFVELQDRYKRFVQICEAHFDVFADDLSIKAETAKAEASRLVRQLRGADSGGTKGSLAELEAFIKRVNLFRTRWNELRQLYLEERKSYLSLQNSWAGREKALREAPESRRTETETEWNRRIHLFVRILEKTSIPLLRDDPAWLLKESAEIEEAWAALKKRGEANVAALARQGEGNGEKKTGKVASIRKGSDAPVRTGKRREQQFAGTASPAGGSQQPSRLAPSASKVSGKAGSDARKGSPEDGSSSASAGGGWSLSTALAVALIGLIMAGTLFLLGARWLYGSPREKAEEKAGAEAKPPTPDSRFYDYRSSR